MAAVMAAICWQGTAFGETTLDERLSGMEQRIKYLEQRVRDQEQAMQTNEEGGIAIGALIEVEASQHDPYAGDSSSDIALATAEIGLSCQFNDSVSGEITLLYEGETTDVDVAAITIAPPGSAWSVTAGQIFVPFSSFESNMVSDPLTLEIGETRESAVQLDFGSKLLTASIYAFNGTNKQNEGADDKIANFGATLAYAFENDSFGLSASAGYINDIGDSDGLQDGLGTNNIRNHVPGQTVSALITAGPFTLIGEYVRASDEFQATELEFNGEGAQPSAWNIEAGYNFALAGKGAIFALGVQGTDEALALELPKTRTLAALSVGILDNTTLAFEYAQDRDYDESDGGTGNTASTITAQLALEF
jgi:hypothetical protein